MLRFENLSPDVTLDWMGRAASDIIASELAGGKQPVLSTASVHASPVAQDRDLAAPGESAEYNAAIAQGADRIVIGQVLSVSGRLVMDVTERDPETGRSLENFTIAVPGANDFYALADAVAHHLSPQATPFETRNNQAIAAWAQGGEERDYTKLSDDYSHAVQADPHFAAAWLAWAAAAAAHGDRPGAQKILSDAQRYASSFTALSRARLKLTSAELAGDRAGALAAMNEIGRLSPDDPTALKAIAAQNYAARNFKAAIDDYRRVVRLKPQDGPVWNQLGYALMATGDYEGAIAALESYRKLMPRDANPPDSEGDVAFALGRFGDAEKYYRESLSINPAFTNGADVYKVAEARLMTGDVAGADKEFAAWAAARRTARDPSLPLHAAQWSFLSGRHNEAMAALAGLPPNAAPQLKALALTQLAIWDLQLDHRDRALQEANLALKTGPPTASLFIARFACEDAHNVSDWKARADRIFANPQLAQLKPLALAYALYLAHQWDAAEPLWKDQAERTSPDDNITPVIYASLLVKLNRLHDAEPYIRLVPLPNPQSIQEFLTLAVPEIFALRAEVLKSDSSRKLFETLWKQ